MENDFTHQARELATARYIIREQRETIRRLRLNLRLRRAIHERRKAIAWKLYHKAKDLKAELIDQRECNERQVEMLKIADGELDDLQQRVNILTDLVLGVRNHAM